MPDKSASVIERRRRGAPLNTRRRTSQLHTWTSSAAVGPVRPVRVAPQDRGQLPYPSAGEGPQPPASSVARTDPSVAQRALKTPSIVLMGGAGMAATAGCRVAVWVFEKTDQAHDVSIVLVTQWPDSQPSPRPGYQDKVDRAGRHVQNPADGLGPPWSRCASITRCLCRAWMTATARPVWYDAFILAGRLSLWTGMDPGRHRRGGYGLSC